MREKERKRDFVSVFFFFFRAHVIKGQEDRQGFRVEVQYLEFGFRLRCVMKKQSSTAHQSLYVHQQKKKKTQKRATGLHVSFFAFDLCPLPPHSSLIQQVLFQIRVSSHPKRCPPLGSGGSSSKENRRLSHFSSSITHIF